MSAQAVLRQNQEGPTLSTEELIARVVAISQATRTHVVGAIDRMQDINRHIHMLSMNARIEAARAGAAGAGFGVVAQELTRLSSEMRGAAGNVVDESRRMGSELDEVLRLLNEDVIANRLCDLAYNAIDIVDRNLYERSCDVRWWATEPAVVRCLQEDSPEVRRHASQRLGQILDSYTVYTDLVVADASGRIVANGRPGQFRSTGMQVERAEWFRSAMATHSGTEFGFESMHDSSLVGQRSVLAYSCAVRDPAVAGGAPLGVLGILFNWKALGQTVVEQIPLSDAERAVTRVCLVDGRGRVLADTAPNAARTLDFMERDALFQGRRGVVNTHVAGRPMTVCHAASPGFETYRTGWHALLLRAVD